MEAVKVLCNVAGGFCFGRGLAMPLASSDWGQGTWFLVVGLSFFLCRGYLARTFSS